MHKEITLPVAHILNSST